MHDLSMPDKQSVVAWLNELLTERFGIAIMLQIADDRWLEMRLDDSGEILRLPMPGDNFVCGNVKDSCVHWNGQREGYRPVNQGFMPMPGIDAVPLRTVEKNGKVTIVQYDILGLAFWMLNRMEEGSSTVCDEHGRFPATASHAFRHGYLERPLVDEWLVILGQVIVGCWPRTVLKEWHSEVVLTHDVDRPSRYGFRSAPGLLKAIAADFSLRGDMWAPFVGPIVKFHIAKGLHRWDPYNTYDWIMDHSEANGRKSAFYFICGRSIADVVPDYCISHPAIRGLLRRIHERGHEIGLHPSYQAGLDESLLSSEVNRLLRECETMGIRLNGWGGRMHYLRCRMPSSFRLWWKAGMSYDSTLGYADLPGFRCGTCHEYRPYDEHDGPSLPIRIRPLIVMDATLLSPQFLGLNSEDSRVRILKLRTQCEQVGGKFVVLWHNTELYNERRKELYKCVTLR